MSDPPWAYEKPDILPYDPEWARRGQAERHRLTRLLGIRDLLATDGWCYVPPELDQRPWRRFFVKPDETGRRRFAHLHVIEAGHPRWERQLAFRDALRRDAGLAARYADLKRWLAAEHPDDREAYTAGKAAFIAEAIGSSAG